MSQIFIAAASFGKADQQLSKLGYIVLRPDEAEGGPTFTRAILVLAADYILISGPQMSQAAAMYLGVAIAAGLRIVHVEPTPDSLDLAPSVSCAFVGTWPDALTFFSKMATAMWVKK